MSTQIPLALGHRVGLGVEDFFVAPSNREAVEWIDRWPDWPSTALIVTGPAGAGKSHLAHLWLERTGASTVDPNALGLEQAAAIAEANKAALIDDAEQAVHTQAAELALLQLYNLLRQAGGHVLMTAATPPRDWNLRLPDLISRLKTAVVATIAPPDDVLLAAIAVKLFADRQITVGEDVIALLLTRGERSFDGLARAVERLDQAALATRRPITAALARTILQETD